tara:strand:- start:23 stop:202 length:180 start_codon:yes stop_codon:yes gene_type:complete
MIYFELVINKNKKIYSAVGNLFGYLVLLSSLTTSGLFLSWDLAEKNMIAKGIKMAKKKK